MIGDLQAFMTAINAEVASGNKIGNTPENMGQCVGLVEVWIQNWLVLDHIWGNAKDLLTNANKSQFNAIFNSPTGVPWRGDIFCFDGYYGEGAGHTGIVIDADVNRVTLFEQNDPDGSTPHVKTYTYDHAIGWLHPYVLDAPASPAPSPSVAPPSEPQSEASVPASASTSPSSPAQTQGTPSAQSVTVQSTAGSGLPPLPRVEQSPEPSPQPQSTQSQGSGTPNQTATSQTSFNGLILRLWSLLVKWLSGSK